MYAWFTCLVVVYKKGVGELEKKIDRERERVIAPSQRRGGSAYVTCLVVVYKGCRKRERKIDRERERELLQAYVRYFCCSVGCGLSVGLSASGLGSPITPQAPF